MHNGNALSPFCQNMAYSFVIRKKNVFKMDKLELCGLGNPIMQTTETKQNSSDVTPIRPEEKLNRNFSTLTKTAHKVLSNSHSFFCHVKIFAVSLCPVYCSQHHGVILCDKDALCVCKQYRIVSAGAVRTG